MDLPSLPAAIRVHLRRLFRGGGLWLSLLVLTAAPAERGRPRDVAHSVPLMFEALDDTRFLARAPGLSLQLQSDGARLFLRSPSDDAQRASAPDRSVQFRLRGSDASAPATPEEALPTRVNYFTGNDPARWRTGVRTYGRVRYHAVYPGVDVVYYGNDRQLEYDFVVAPGVDPGQIRLRIEGADAVRVTAEGDLVLTLGDAELRQRAPVAYQWIEGRRRPVVARHALTPGAMPEVGFSLGTYDATAALVIDPVLTHATYFGGNLFDLCRRMAVTADGKVVVVGETTSTNLPVRNPLLVAQEVGVTNGLGGTNFLWVTNYSGAINHGGPGAIHGNTLGNEGFIARFASDGTQLEYVTYLGGSSIDAPLDVALDAQGNLLVAGLTMSPDFPTLTNAWSGIATRQISTTNVVNGTNEISVSLAITNAWPIPEGWDPFWSTNIHGDVFWGYYPQDGFLTMLSPDGDRLLFSGLLGADGNDWITRLSLGPEGRLYLIGVAGSDLFPSDNALELGNFVACLESNRLVYSRSGFGMETPLAMEPLAGGGLWVVGQTQNPYLTNYLDALGASFVPYQTNLFGFADAFLTRLGPDGLQTYYTYLGGNGGEIAYGVSVDPAGDILIAGTTTSTNFPVRNALVATNTGLQDLFVARLDATLTNLVFSTYQGGSLDDTVEAVRRSPQGGLVLAGWTQSSDFPGAPLGAERAGLVNCLLLDLAPDGSAVHYVVGSELGYGEIHDVGFSPEGLVWFAGWSPGVAPESISYPTVWWHPTAGTNTLANVGFLMQLYPGEAELAAGVSVEGQPTVSWPAVLPGFALQLVSTLGATNLWTDSVATTVQGTNHTYTVTNALPEGYFRLRRSVIFPAVTNAF